jgi:mannose-6-phosphate isomerase-like protein (cupin superfamily)
LLTAHTVRPEPEREYPTPEGCFILESWNVPEDAAVSIARARVPPAVTTRLHRLAGVTERYVIVQGEAIANVDGRSTGPLGPGDIVVIPAGASQQITNTGDADLVFYCVCTPRFTSACYEALDRAEDHG